MIKINAVSGNVGECMGAFRDLEMRMVLIMKKKDCNGARYNSSNNGGKGAGGCCDNGIDCL